MVKKRLLPPSLGVTLIEMMIVVAILGILASVGPLLLKNVTRFYRLNAARLETVRDARNCLTQINQALRQATASTIVISQESGQPPYSTIFAQTVDSRSLKFYQSGNKLNFVQNASTVTISENLRYIAFTYPRTDDSTILSVSVTFEKKTYEGQTKAIQMAIEKVRIMN
ncbi:MAG: prepilin-type N-terminal cleavage/methylation domain-containing protein [Elusimicrobia bacterium]|nr:prepilin-type N-terminal cleavage/methylation domain-containing protein [Candidatus Obscuribacterium magneticum]